ncbi:MAG: hypothetical protein V7459_04970 [Oceanicoccus sp.]
MKIVPFSAGCGVEVCDRQRNELNDMQLAELRSTFNEHGVVVFCDQQFEPE